MKKVAVVLIAILALVVGGAGAQEQPFTALWSHDGIIALWNESRAHFTVEMVGKNVQPTDLGGLALVIDGKLIQIVVSDPSEFPAGGSDSASLLQRHREWESTHWSEQIGQQLVPQTLTHPGVNAPAQMWELRFPRELRSDGKVQLATTLFVTQAIGDRVLTLSRPVMVGEDEARAKDYLAAVLGSLEVSAQPISVEQVQAKIQAGP